MLKDGDRHSQSSGGNSINHEDEVGGDACVGAGNECECQYASSARLEEQQAKNESRDV